MNFLNLLKQGFLHERVNYDEINIAILKYTMKNLMGSLEHLLNSMKMNIKPKKKGNMLSPVLFFLLSPLLT